MSATKKREKAPLVLTPLQQHTADIQAQFPSVAPLLQLVQQRLQAIRLNKLHEEWQQAKQTGTPILQAFSNGWIKHCSDLVTGATSRQLYEEAFGPLAEGEVESPERAIALHALQKEAHLTAVKTAEGRIQQLRNCIQKMRAAYDLLNGHVQFLQDSWCKLYHITSQPSSTNSDSTTSTVTPTSTEPTTALTNSMGELSISSFLPTDIAVASNATLNLKQCIASLSPLLLMYESDLHTKLVLVDAISKMVKATPQYPNQSPGRLLQSADEAAKSAATLSVTSTKPLAFYLATWIMEPDISIELVNSTHQLLEAQLSTGKVKNLI